jgi:GT2 family glycosyltransferase
LAQYDTVVSFVLYQTSPTEIRTAVDQVLVTGGRHHVVLVDNSVPELDLEEFRSPQVTVIRSGGNVGYGAGHNKALRAFAGTARYHLVLNTDLWFGPDVIEEMVAFMDSNPNVGLAMPAVRYPNGEPQYLCRLLPRPIDILGRAFFPNTQWSKALTRRYESHDWAHDEALSFPFLSGCFMVIRANDLAKTGLFDERFFLFAEDLDLSRRLHRTSQTVLCPNASVVHEYRNKTQRSLMRRVHLVRSFIAYFNKYGWFFDPERTAMNSRTLECVTRSHSEKGRLL